MAQKGYRRLFGKPAAQSPAAKHSPQQSLSEVSEQSPDATAAVEPPPVNRETRALNSIYKPISFISPCAVRKHLIHPQPFFSPRLAAGKGQTTVTQAETVQSVRAHNNPTKTARCDRTAPLPTVQGQGQQAEVSHSSISPQVEVPDCGTRKSPTGQSQPASKHAVLTKQGKEKMEIN